MPENVDSEDFYRYVPQHEHSQRRSGSLSNTSLSAGSAFDDIFRTLSLTENAASNPQGFSFIQEHSTTTQGRPSNHQPMSQEHLDLFGTRLRSENQLPLQYTSGQVVKSENSVPQAGSLNFQTSGTLERSAGLLQQPAASRERESSILSSRGPRNIYSESTSSQRIGTNVGSTRQPSEALDLPGLVNQPPRSGQGLPKSMTIPYNPFRKNSKPVPPISEEIFTVGPGSTYQWNISATRVRQWEQVHQQWSGDIGVLIRAKAAEFFGKSGLERNVLGQIWKFADTDLAGFLTAFQFQVAMHLALACKAGHQERALDLEVVETLKSKLRSSQWGVLLAPVATAGMAHPYTRAQYEEACIEELLPRPEEVTGQIKNGSRPSRTPRGTEDGPLKDINYTADPLDAFDESDLSDDPDIVSHRISYYRQRVISFFREGKYSDALVELQHCGYNSPFTFRTLVLKAILQNMDRNNKGNRAVAAVTIAKAVYSPQDSVLANLLLYFTRALSRYYFGNNYQTAFEDCKRGLKLAKLANIQPHDRLATFVKSDLAELAAVITLRNNATADTQFYRAMVEENHETHHLINTERERIALSPLEHKQGREFLSQYNVSVDENLLIRGRAIDVFLAFDSSLSTEDFAACYLLAAAADSNGRKLYELRNKNLVGQDMDIYKRLFKTDTVYPPSFLHFIASYPETKFGPRIATELIRSGMSVHAISFEQQPPSLLQWPPSTDFQLYGYDPSYHTPLGLATIFNNIPLMYTLIDHGASMGHTIGSDNLSRALSFRPSPLYLATYFAASIGSLDPLKHLINERNADALGIHSITPRQVDYIEILKNLGRGYHYNSSQLRGDKEAVNRTIEAFQALVVRLEGQISFELSSFRYFKSSDPDAGAHLQDALKRSLSLWRELPTISELSHEAYPAFEAMTSILDLLGPFT